MINDETGEVEGGPSGLRGKKFDRAESKGLADLRREKGPTLGDRARSIEQRKAATPKIRTPDPEQVKPGSYDDAQEGHKEAYDKALSMGRQGGQSLAALAASRNLSSGGSENDFTRAYQAHAAAEVQARNAGEHDLANFHGHTQRAISDAYGRVFNKDIADSRLLPKPVIQKPEQGDPHLNRYNQMMIDQERKDYPEKYPDSPQGKLKAYDEQRPLRGDLADYTDKVSELTNGHPESDEAAKAHLRTFNLATDETLDPEVRKHAERVKARSSKVLDNEDVPTLNQMRAAASAAATASKFHAKRGEEHLQHHYDTLHRSFQKMLDADAGTDDEGGTFWR
jgi:hypothetical protein